MTAPLAGLRVVDSTNDRGELCARLLADLGADVILVEPPEGSSLRDRHPRSPDGEHSLAFAWRNANKRGIALDLTTIQGQAKFDDLLATADVWIESSRPGTTPDPAELAVRHPHLVVTSITPFGRSGPNRDLVANDDVLCGFSGFMYKAGIASKPPLLPPTPMATDISAVVAAMATLLAVHQRGASGKGQHVDLAVVTATGAATDWAYANASVIKEDGREYNELRNGGGFMYPIFACRDGFVRMVILSPRQWLSMWDWMGRPEAFADETFWARAGNRIANADVLNPAYEAFFADKAMLQVCSEGQSRGIVVTPVLTPAEVLADPHFEARRTFVGAEIAPGVHAPIASGFVEIDGERRGFSHRAPTVDEHQGAAFEDPPIEFPAVDPDATPRAPLEGLRVLDFGIGGVGVEASRVLGEYGADVIKVESRTYPDFIRLVALSETSPSFVSSSRSKRSLGVNVKMPDGLELVRKLVARADVLVENSSTGTLASLGLGYDALRLINPELIMVSSQLVGSRGPNAHWTGYGPTTQTYGGLVHLWDYDDDDPPASNQTIYPDHMAGRLCAMSAVAALIARRSSGAGAHVEVAQVEAVVNMLSERLLQESLSPGSARAMGNRSPEFAPRGPYACEGHEQWTIISVRTDDEWGRLRVAIGSPEWAADPSFDHVSGRLAHAATIEEHLGGWTSQRSRHDVVDALQAAGIPCGPMSSATEMLDDPHLKARGWTIRIDQPGIGPIQLEGPAWVAPDMNGPVTFPAPGLGQHTRQIATELLDLHEDEIDQLIERGILEIDPAAGS